MQIHIKRIPCPIPVQATPNSQKRRCIDCNCTLRSKNNGQRCSLHQNAEDDRLLRLGKFKCIGLEYYLTGRPETNPEPRQAPKEYAND